MSNQLLSNRPPTRARVFRLMSIDTLKNVSAACKANGIVAFWTPAYLYYRVPDVFTKSVFTTCNPTTMQWHSQFDLYNTATMASHSFSITGDYGVDDVISEFDRNIEIALHKQPRIDYSSLRTCFVDKSHFAIKTRANS